MIQKTQILAGLTAAYVAGLIAIGFVIFAATTAQAGLCGGHISSDWNLVPYEGQAIIPSSESPGFAACQTPSLLSGIVETEIGEMGIDRDVFNFAVEAVDDDTLRLSAESKNLDFEDTHFFPGLTLTLSGITWLSGPGAIHDVIDAGSDPNFFEVIGFTDDSISFNWILGSVAGSLFSPDEFTIVEEFDLVVVPTAVPEPGTLALLGLGLTGLAFAQRHRRRRKVLS